MSAGAASPVDDTVFRAYDIRGLADRQLGGDVPERIGRAFAQLMKDRSQGRVAVGRDGRLSSPRIADALAAGLVAAGMRVVDIGLVPTPMLYEYALARAGGNGVMVTGSHNPKEHNGMKMMLCGKPVVDRQIRGLAALAERPRLPAEPGGTLEEDSFGEEYTRKLAAAVAIERTVRIAVDCGNGAAGAIAPAALRAAGCEVDGLHTDIDGNFPNHHPDPADPQNLKDCGRALAKSDAEFAIAFDGDGDRLGVVARGVGMVFPDLILMLYAEQVLQRSPGAKVVYDVKCTRKLKPWIEERGGVPVMARTGHSFIKKLMREENALLGGEMSGHFFFRDRWSGYDDAIYAAARLAELVSASSLDALLGSLPKTCATPELKIDMNGADMPAAAAVEQVASVLAASGEGTPLRTDGIRMEYDNGFGLLRASNTTQSLVLRFEGDTPADLERIRRRFADALQTVGLAVGDGLT